MLRRKEGVEAQSMFWLDFQVIWEAFSRLDPSRRASNFVLIQHSAGRSGHSIDGSEDHGPQVIGAQSMRDMEDNPRSNRDG